jgi:hypothetical protein
VAAADNVSVRAAERTDQLGLGSVRGDAIAVIAARRRMNAE